MGVHQRISTSALTHVPSAAFPVHGIVRSSTGMLVSCILDGSILSCDF